jgi:hypothetical protein
VTPAVPDVPVAGVNPEPADRHFRTPSPEPDVSDDLGDSVADLIDEAEAEDAAARDGLNGGGETTLGEGAARDGTSDDEETASASDDAANESEDDAAAARQRRKRARSVTSTIVTAPVGLLDERFGGPRRKTLLGG